MLCLDRRRNDWDELVYRCRLCDESARRPSEIDHDSHLLPDLESLVPVAPDTRRLLREIIRRSRTVAPDLYADEIREEISGMDGVRWTDSGSTGRFVVGLGRTNPRGKWHLSDRRGLVLKIHPTIWSGDPGISGNISEISTWETAVEHGESDFFADLLGCAPHGAWLLIEECLPVYPVHRAEMSERDAVWDSDKELIGPLLAAMRESGWSEFDYKHGNIGLDSSGTPVFLDYGTGPVRADV